MERKIIATAALLGALAVILGAFGAHGLKSMLPPEQLTVFETGVRYQMYHALLLFFVGNSTQLPLTAKKNVVLLVAAGILFFSGSLYLLSCAAIVGIDTKIVGPATPIGGLLLILGWMVIFAKILGKKAE